MIWKFLKQNVLFPKGLNWVQHWVSRIGLWTRNCSNYSFFSGSSCQIRISLTSIVIYERGGHFSRVKRGPLSVAAAGSFRTSSLARSLRDLMHWSSLRSLLRTYERQLVANLPFWLQKSLLYPYPNPNGHHLRPFLICVSGALLYIRLKCNNELKT